MAAPMRREYGLDIGMEAHVAAAVAQAALRGFPRDTEAIWIVELDGRHAGSLAMTDEGEGVACIRFFLLDSDLRGSGLGRRLLVSSWTPRRPGDSGE